MKKQSTSGFWLPSDLTSEILLRCVSKLWYRSPPIHVSSSFLELHGSQVFYSAQNQVKICLLILSDRTFLLSLFIVILWKFQEKSVTSPVWIIDVKSRIPLVWNPTMGQLLALPKPNISSRHINLRRQKRTWTRHQTLPRNSKNLHLSCQEHYQSQSNDKQPTLGCAIASKGSPP